MNEEKAPDYRTKQNLKGMYKVVSTQSSAKPGCILWLSKIADANLVSLSADVVINGKNF